MTSKDEHPWRKYPSCAPSHEKERMRWHSDELLRLELGMHEPQLLQTEEEEHLSLEELVDLHDKLQDHVND